jgi:hypothetical protein
VRRRGLRGHEAAEGMDGQRPLGLRERDRLERAAREDDCAMATWERVT